VILRTGRIGGYIFRDLKKAGKMPKIKDLLIAATCIANDKKLITGDGDFEFFKKYGLDVEIILRDFERDLILKKRSRQKYE